MPTDTSPGLPTIQNTFLVQWRIEPTQTEQSKVHWINSTSFFFFRTNNLEHDGILRIYNPKGITRINIVLVCRYSLLLPSDYSHNAICSCTCCINHIVFNFIAYNHIFVVNGVASQKYPGEDNWGNGSCGVNFTLAKLDENITFLLSCLQTIFHFEWFV